MSRTRQLGANSHLQTSTESRDSSTARLSGTLRLRGEETRHTSEPSPARRIRWSEDVVDNEGMGKKSSKGQYSCLHDRQGNDLLTTRSVLHLPQISTRGRKQL